MARIESSQDITQWTRLHVSQVEEHQGWRPNILKDEEAANLLKDSAPFTYLLRHGEKKNEYILSFVQEDRAIKHKSFVLEFDRKGWFYRNGQAENYPTEVFSDDIEKLIPLMMYCDPSSSTRIKGI